MDQNSMLYWWPLVKELDIPMPWRWEFRRNERCRSCYSFSEWIFRLTIDRRCFRWYTHGRETSRVSSVSKVSGRSGCSQHSTGSMRQLDRRLNSSEVQQCQTKGIMLLSRKPHCYQTSSGRLNHMLAYYMFIWLARELVETKGLLIPIQKSEKTRDISTTR